ncbi:inhibitor of sigma-G Gin [Paenibacillus ginsengarvi]|uniref:Inhibitor of sigma-G Gin n=2 Tax=Paenibacillus ginsengarvi TaxID=400777 RepID=A0A3B0AZT3_9BACL|nr:inhibitor of sigma-G Gin [Paenibacillus ginsengarvi]
MEQAETVRNTCIICDQPKPNGIQICAEFICDECEAEIVKTDVLDVKYPFFIHRMNKIWYKMNA